MPFQGRMRIIVFLVILLTALWLQQQNDPIRSQLYAANPVMNITNLFARPGDFRNMLHLEPCIFINQIISYYVVTGSVSFTRNYLIRDDYQAYGFIINCRQCQIDFILRAVRFILWTRNVGCWLLSFLFDQSLTVTYNDIHHQGILMVDILENIHIQQIIPFTARYFRKIATGAFRHFARVLRAIDIIKITMTRPWYDDEDEYYDGYNHEYNFGAMISVCCEGLCETYNVHLPGSQNDLNNYYSSDLYNYPGLFYGPGDHGLGDGSFTNIDDRMIGPVCRMPRPLTLRETNFNMIQQWDRAIIENYNWRLLAGCPVLRYYTFGVDSINYMFVACLILTNIRIKYQSPLRRY